MQRVKIWWLVFATILNADEYIWLCKYFFSSTTANKSCSGAMFCIRQAPEKRKTEWQMDWLTDPFVGFGRTVITGVHGKVLHSNLIKISCCYFQHVIELESLINFTLVRSVLCSGCTPISYLHLIEYEIHQNSTWQCGFPSDVWLQTRTWREIHLNLTDHSPEEESIFFSPEVLLLDIRCTFL